MQKFAMRPRRRSSSRIQRWVQDQQEQNCGGDSTQGYSARADEAKAEPPPDASSLAYPHLDTPVFATEREDISVKEESYVLVARECEDVDDELDDGPGIDAVVTLVSVTLHVTHTRN